MAFFGIVFIVLNGLAFKNKVALASISGYLTFFFFVASFGLLATQNGQAIYLLDFCEEIIQITDNNILPIYGQGIGYSMSCLPTQANIAATTLSYDSYTEYNRGILLANLRLRKLGYAQD